jgi:hypothetical protein
LQCVNNNPPRSLNALAPACPRQFCPVVEPMIDTIPLAIKVMRYPVSLVVEPVLDAVTLAIQVIRPPVVAMRGGPLRAPVEAIIDHITANIQPFIDSLATLVEPVINAVTPCIPIYFGIYIRRHGQQHCPGQS